MICLAIADKNTDTCLQILNQSELAEIRIDLCEFNEEQVRKVFSHATPKVATCRGEKMGPEKQYTLLKAALETGAAYVDVEIEAGKEQINRIADLARKANCKLIVSYHNYEETPAQEALQKIISECFELGADVAKVATQVNQATDNARLLSLYEDKRPLIILGMGETGKLTRIVAPFMGAEFTFAAVDSGEHTADGQISNSRMKTIISKLQQELD